MSEAPNKQPSGWKRFWRGVWLFIVWLFRLIIAIGGGVLLGAGIFYVANVGVPQFYSQVLNPIQVNTTKLDIVQSDLQSVRMSVNEDLRSSRDDIRALRQTVNDQQVVINRLVAQLEAEEANREQSQERLQTTVLALDGTVQLQSIALEQVQAAVAGNDEELAATAAALSTEIAAVETRVGELDSSLTTLVGTANALGDDLTVLASEVDAAKQGIESNESANAQLAQTVALLQTDLDTFSGALDTTQGELADLQAVITMPITLSDAFERRLVLMQAWQEIMRARVHLLEGNAGLATQSLNLALGNVDKYVGLSTDMTEDMLAPIQERVDTAMGLIETDPFLAVQELEIIWYNLEDMIAAPILPEQAPTGETAVEETAAEEPAAEQPGEEEAAQGEEGATTEGEAGTEEEAATEEGETTEGESSGG